MSTMYANPEQEQQPGPIRRRVEVVGSARGIIEQTALRGFAPINTPEIVSQNEQTALDYLSQAPLEPSRPVASFVVESEANNQDEARARVLEALQNDN